MGAQGQGWAVLIALALFLAVRTAWEWWADQNDRLPSPGLWVRLAWYAKELLNREPETEPDPDDTDPEPTTEHPWGFTGAAGRRVDVGPADTGERALRLGPLARPTRPKADPREQWVRESRRRGARYTDLVRDGCQRWGCSVATMKRVISKTRG